MKDTISVALKDSNYCLLEGITFSQVPYWFPFFDTRDLKMNLILPFGKPDKPLPLLVWVCGGGWITMDRGAHTPFLLNFAEQGYIVASVEYRRANSGTFPAPLEDVKCAIRYLRAHAAEYGIDPSRVTIMGESAGAYLAAMAGTTGEEKKFDVGAYLEQSSAVSAVVDFYGPTNFLQVSPREDPLNRARPDQMMLGYSAACDPEHAKEACVDTYVNAKTPPFLILHGLEDPMVPYSQSEYLYQALQKAGVRSDLLLIEGAGHAAPHFYQKETAARVISFLDSILKK